MKFFQNSDRIIGVSAMLISLLTLFIFLYQTNLIKDQSRLSVRPRLTFSKNVDKSINLSDSLESTVTLRLAIRNNGLGPAIIESASIIDNGKQYDMLSFFNTVYPKLQEFGVFTQVTELNIGEAIPASESINLFSYEYGLLNESKVYEYLNVKEAYDLPFSILVTYSSMYEEKWKVESNTDGHPEKLD